MKSSELQPQLYEEIEFLLKVKSFDRLSNVTSKDLEYFKNDNADIKLSKNLINIVIDDKTISLRAFGEM